MHQTDAPPKETLLLLNSLILVKLTLVVLQVILPIWTGTLSSLQDPQILVRIYSPRLLINRLTLMCHGPVPENTVLRSVKMFAKLFGKSAEAGVGINVTPIARLTPP